MWLKIKLINKFTWFMSCFQNFTNVIYIILPVKSFLYANTDNINWIQIEYKLNTNKNRKKNYMLNKYI